MNIARYILLWICSFAFTSLIDAFWHLGLFRRTYAEGIKPLARMSGDKMAFKGLPGLLSQIMVVTCVVILVLYKAQRGTIGEAAVIGALAGILAISVYGITNYALFKDWGITITLLELVWGPLLGGLSGMFVFWLKTLLIK